MKQHSKAGVLAGLILLALSTRAVAKEPISDHARIIALQREVTALHEQLERLEATRAEASARRTGKHAWPDLSEQQKAALTAVLKTLPKSTRFDIICNDAGCSDLAMDIDDAMEAAGLDSVLDHSLGPLGYGIAVQVNAADRPAAETAIAALKKATGGRLDLPLIEAPPGANAKGYVSILIGKFHKTDNK